MFKKILGLAICVATIATSIVPAHAAKDTGWKTEVLKGLGVYQENPVTYDNFINSLAGFLYENPSEIGDAESIARSTGMIEDDATYSGNSALTIGEACKLAVITLGYKPAIGIDGNYMQKASELGIADGISANGGDRLKNDVAVNILYDMIDASPLVKTFGGKNGIQYEVAYKESLLSINRNIYEVKGIFTGTEITSIYGTEYVANKDCITIDDVTYFAETNRFDNLLGKSVVAYIQESDTVYDEVLYVGEAQGKNETIIIDCDDIKDIGDSISYIKYYNSSEKIKEIDIIASPRVIYNGVFLEEYTTDDFSHGVLELIDNNGDKKYDIIKISAYQTMVVEAIDSREMIIKNRYRFTGCITELSLNTLRGEDISYRIFDSIGEETEFSAIKVDDILNVAKSRDGKIIDIYISGNGDMAGTVTGIDRRENTLTIDGEVYEISEDYTKFIESTGKNIQLGKTYIFSVDYFGKLAYVKETVDNDYNIIIKVYLDEETDEYCIVYMDMNGDWYTAQVAEKAKIDGVRPADIYEAMEALREEDPQVVLFKFNSQKQIMSIDKAGTYGETNDSSFCKRTLTNYTYRENDRYFQSGSNIVYLEDDAKVIVIPADGSKSKIDWNIYSAGSFFRGDNNQYSVVCFNPDEFNFTDLVTIVQSTDITRTKASRALYVITAKEDILVDDEAHPVIKGSVDGFINLSFIGKEEGMFDDLEEGDVVNFALDQNGMIDYVEKKFSLSDFSSTLGAIYSESSLHAGIVEDISYEEGKIMLDCDGTLIPFRLSVNMQVTVYNEGEGCESKPLDSISRGDKLLIRTAYGKAQEIVCTKD